MKLAEILDVEFRMGLDKLKKSNLSMALNFKLEEISTAIEAELAKYETVRQSALKKYGQLKEDGNLLLDEVGQVIFKAEEEAKSFFKEHEELASTEIQIGKIKVQELLNSGAQMTQNEFRKVKAAITEL